MEERGVRGRSEESERGWRSHESEGGEGFRDGGPTGEV